MKKIPASRWIVALALTGAMALAGCNDSGEDDDAAASPVIRGVTGIAGVGEEVHLGSAASAHPTIAMDALNQPHIYTDQERDNEIFEYHRINGAWTAERVFAQGISHGKYKASRMYLPHLAIDSRNRGWLSAKFGNKEWGSFLGQGFWVINDMTNNPTEALFKFVGINKGNGNIDIDPFEPDYGVLLATDGAWNKFDASGNLVGAETLNVGSSGEKIRFAICPRENQVGVWHAAMSGWSRMDASYNNSVRNAAGLPPVPWANFSKYPEMGEDYYHPGVGIDWANPNVCYISADFDVGVVVNVWDGSNMRFPANNLFVLDGNGSVGTERMGPQWASLPGGGAYVCWTRNSENRIKMRRVNSDGSMEAELDVCEGNRASMCTDTAGNIHLVYNNRGTCYRTIQLAVTY